MFACVCCCKGVNLKGIYFQQQQLFHFSASKEKCKKNVKFAVWKNWTENLRHLIDACACMQQMVIVCRWNATVLFIFLQCCEVMSSRNKLRIEFKKHIHTELL